MSAVSFMLRKEIQSSPSAAHWPVEGRILKLSRHLRKYKEALIRL